MASGNVQSEYTYSHCIIVWLGMHENQAGVLVYLGWKHQLRNLSDHLSNGAQWSTVVTALLTAVRCCCCVRVPQVAVQRPRRFPASASTAVSIWCQGAASQQVAGGTQGGSLGGRV
jgi:hypothetical protein